MIVNVNRDGDQMVTSPMRIRTYADAHRKLGDRDTGFSCTNIKHGIFA